MGINHLHASKRLLGEHSKNIKRVLLLLFTLLNF